MPLEIEENLTVNLTAMLKSGKLDVIMIALPFEEPGILTQALYDEPFKAVVPADHRLAKRSKIDSALLSTERVLLPHAGHCFRQQVLESCPELSRSDTESLQGNSLETIRQMVASGLGITVMPCSAVTAKHQNKRLAVLEFMKPVPERRIALAWRKGFTRPSVIPVIQDAVAALKIPGLMAIASGSIIVLTMKGGRMAESRISTHVLDIAQGRPAQGMPVTLEGQGLAGIWKLLGKSRTDADGRSNDLYPAKQRLQPGVYRLTFDVSTYFRSQHVTSFYPEVVVHLQLCPTHDSRTTFRCS
jgi:hydroxyisourate hydrolase